MMNKQEIIPDVIMNGNKVMRLNIPFVKATFLDSYFFLSMKLIYFFIIIIIITIIIIIIIIVSFIYSWNLFIFLIIFIFQNSRPV